MPPFFLGFALSRGQLRIAEVTSRFTNIDSFLYLIGSMGFKISHKVRSSLSSDFQWRPRKSWD